MAFEATIGVDELDGNNGFRLPGLGTSDQTGSSVTSIGDINGDGIDDLVVGARLADTVSAVDAGKVYVIFGNANGFPPVFDFNSLDGTNGFALNGDRRQ